MVALIFVGMISRESWGAESEYSGWKVSGEVAVMTTPEGGDLAAGVVLEGFPLLIRLKKDWFDIPASGWQKNPDSPRCSGRRWIRHAKNKSSVASGARAVLPN